MRSRFLTLASLVLPMVTLLGACASSMSPATVIRTLYIPEQAGFQNILVISVAGDFESRASFEQQLVSAIAGGNVSAAPYFTVIGRRPQLTRSYMNDAIRAREFDAVLLTRLKGQELEEPAQMRPVGSRFDLFDYDYEELNRGASITPAPAITFVTELYATATQKKVWSIDTLSLDKTMVIDLIAEQAFTVASQLQVDGLLDR